ncbi:hypothetical protein ElyMa_002808200 [Elysia marginata]|uniref:Uncharacterized protein n=1 Tax=Elysia marginata TaxID=1093978 RepID=A0AAV4HPK4_9GAST|nr:hypothetical protein ElyMa_002808200 [Elysia marginata]
MVEEHEKGCRPGVDNWRGFFAVTASLRMTNQSSVCTDIASSSCGQYKSGSVITETLKTILSLYITDNLPHKNTPCESETGSSDMSSPYGLLPMSNRLEGQS